MRVIWNSYEPPVPLDIANDELDFILECHRPDGAQVTVKRTQISTSGEVWITVNGKSAGANKTDPLIVGKYAISILSYEDDHISSLPVAIVSHELKGKSLRLRVAICP